MRTLEKEVNNVARSTSEQTSEMLMLQETNNRICLPVGWTRTLPPADQAWVSKALFMWSAEKQPEIDYSRVDRLWWCPPSPPLTLTEIPDTGHYFGHALFLWMPKMLWDIKLTCPHLDCGKEELISTGLYQELRQVVDVDRSYFMASECLACGKCRRKVISWSHEIVSQLDIGHRLQFPCILTSKLACDMKVVRLIRQRGLETSINKIQKKLQDYHYETWLHKVAQYLTDCKDVASAVTSGLGNPLSFKDPPDLLPLPKHCWLTQVFALDVLHRMNELKASITSHFGRVLKIGSTNTIACKLSGHCSGPTTWATSVTNEHGQVIISVLTANEDSGLRAMINGLMERYKDAGVFPPEVVYVNRNCCGSTSLRRMFEKWIDIEIRLDISNFMRRIAVGCTTESHQLYATFMNCLSHCIFKWDEDDLKQLIEAKRMELKSEIMQPSDADVMHHLSISELTLHCRQITRDVKEIEDLITELIQAYDGEEGCDSSGAPLFSSLRMAEIWSSQRKHIACIQDPLGVQLYEQTGTLVKEGHLLPTYKCVRGSTSLECFHKHLNQVIPGVLSSATIFQIYLLDGVVRWNDDKATATTSEGLQELPSFNGLLQHAVNILGEKVLGKKVVSVTSTSKYTGELIGLEYLYQQTGNALQDYRSVIRQLETIDVQVAEDKGCVKHEDIRDLSIPTMTTTQQPTLSLSTASTSLVTRGLQIQVENTFDGVTFMGTSPERTPSAIKQETTLEYSCDDMPDMLSSTQNTSVMENKTTRHINIEPVRPVTDVQSELPSSAFPFILPCITQPQQMMMILAPSAQKNDQQTQSLTSTPPFPRTTRTYWKRKLARQQDGKYTRKYVRKAEAILCRKCNKVRNPSTHHQYYGNWYCAETATKPFAVWKAELLTRGYGKKKT